MGGARSIIDALASIVTIVGTIFGLFLILTFAIGIIQNAYTWTDASPPAIIDSIDVWRLGMVVGTTGTASAVMVTLFVAGSKLQKKQGAYT